MGSTSTAPSSSTTAVNGKGHVDVYRTLAHPIQGSKPLDPAPLAIPRGFLPP